MAFIDKLKAVFVVSEDNKNKSSNPVEPIKDSPDLTNKKYIPNTNSAPNTQKFIELLSGILEKNNFPGYDYYEYKKAIHSVSKIGNMEEMMMHKTVFAAAQSMNVDANHLIVTAKKYLTLLENENINFNQAADNYLSQQIQTKNTELKSLQQSIAENKKMIEELSNELTRKEDRLQILDSELKDVKQKVDVNKSDFNISYITFVDEIKQDIQKMEKYLL